MTKSELLKEVDRVIAKWQPVLSLEQWRIRSELVTEDDINGNAVEVTWEPNLQWAIVKIVDPSEIDVNPLIADIFELEKTIVHELCHVLLDPVIMAYRSVEAELSPSAMQIAKKQWDRANEQVTERIAMALIALKGGEGD